jgi:hypothetical protein
MALVPADSNITLDQLADLEKSGLSYGEWMKKRGPLKGGGYGTPSSEKPLLNDKNITTPPKSSTAPLSSGSAADKPDPSKALGGPLLGTGKITDVIPNIPNIPNIPIPTIPTFPQTSSKTQTGVLGQTKAAIPKEELGDYRVFLVSILDLTQSPNTGDIKRVIFKVTPQISESRSVDYTPVQPIHLPGGIQIYKFTGSRTFEISAHFISRNSTDALENIKLLQTLRSWTMPFFGATKVLKGAPPEVLYLYGYSPSSSYRKNVNGININRIPVVMTSLSITYPEDVDYIQTKVGSTNTEPFPVKMDVNISLIETHSPYEYERFDLIKFKKGELVSF